MDDLPDLIRRTREVLDRATRGPWEACPMDLFVYGGDGHMVADRFDDEDGPGAILRRRGYGAEVAGQRREGEAEANVRAAVLAYNTARALLDVLEAAGRTFGGGSGTPLGDAVDRAEAVLREHVQRSAGN